MLNNPRVTVLKTALVLSVLCSGCGAYSALRPAPLPEGAVVHKNVAYAPLGADPDRHKLDLYLPKGPGPHPVVIFIHGGYWQYGGRQETFGVYARLGRRLARAETIGVVISYRLSPRYRYPVHTEDVAAAIASTVKNVEKHGGDPSRIYLVGHSAGGHLAMVAALEPRWLGMHGVSASALAGVVSISGVYDVNHLARSSYGARNVRRVFGADEELWRRASPVNLISKKPKTQFLMAIGDDDEGMLKEQHVEMMRALRKVNADAVEVEVVDRNHNTVVTELFSETDQLGEQIFEMIKQPRASHAPSVAR
jgi:acetyl esterase/lipase